MTNRKFKVLLVDDNIENIKLALAILEKANYHVFFATSGVQALKMLEDKVAEFDFILLDIMMPELNGFETCKRIKQNPSTKDIPVIFITAKTDAQSIGEAYSVGGIDYICKPFFSTELLMKLKTHLSLSQAKRILETENFTLSEKLTVAQSSYYSEIKKSQQELLSVLTNIVNYSQNEANQQGHLITKFATKFAQIHPFLEAEDEKVIQQAAPLHDIGKLIKKDDASLPTEGLKHAIEEDYATKGYWILNSGKSNLLQKSAIIAFQHRESWDGSGFPLGLKGEEAHIYARVVGLSVVIYEMLQGIHLKKPKNIDDLAEYLKRFSGFKFDPLLVQLFTDHLDEFKAILSAQ